MDAFSAGMLGVMGQMQQTCATCLERRVQCDNSRPCGPCSKNHVACKEYSRGQRFVEEESSNQSRPETVPSRQIMKLLKSRLRRVEEGTTALIVSRDGLARNTQAMSCMDMFWRAYLPNAQDLPEDVIRNMQGGWVKAAQRYSSSEGTVRKIIMALALTSTGRERGREDLVNRGWQLHSATLREVSSALQTKKTAQSNQLLATIRLFGIFEVLHGSPSRVPPSERGTHNTVQSKNFEAHGSGDLAILHSRGPEAFIDGDAHRLFADGRQYTIGAAIGNRKRIFLGEKAWKTIPWTKHPKCARDELLDVMVDLPALLEAIDEMKALTDTVLKERWRKYLSTAALLCSRNLTAWYDKHFEDLSRFMPDPYIEGEQVSITTRELSSCHVMSLYWSSCIIMATIQYALEPPQSTPGPPSDSTLACKAKADEHFRRLVSILPYFFGPEAGFYRIHISTLGFHTASTYIRQEMAMGDVSHERDIMRGILEKRESACVKQLLDGLGMQFIEK